MKKMRTSLFKLGAFGLFLGFLPLLPAHAELIGYVDSEAGVVYFLTETKSGCDMDQQVVLVQSAKYPNGAPRVLKTAGCWTEKMPGVLVANWPDSGATEYRRSDMKTLK